MSHRHSRRPPPALTCPAPRDLVEEAQTSGLLLVKVGSVYRVVQRSGAFSFHQGGNGPFAIEESTLIGDPQTYEEAVLFLAALTASARARARISPMS